MKDVQFQYVHRQFLYVLEDLHPKAPCRNILITFEELVSEIINLVLAFLVSIYTDVEDLKEQELVSRIMAGLLENYDELFENEEEDFSSNDLSSVTEQVRIVYSFILIKDFAIKKA